MIFQYARGIYLNKNYNCLNIRDESFDSDDIFLRIDSKYCQAKNVNFLLKFKGDKSDSGSTLSYMNQHAVKRKYAFYDVFKVGEAKI